VHECDPFAVKGSIFFLCPLLVFYWGLGKWWVSACALTCLLLFFFFKLNFQFWFFALYLFAFTGGWGNSGFIFLFLIELFFIL
jgi:hypothetical protein